MRRPSWTPSWIAPFCPTSGMSTQVFRNLLWVAYKDQELKSGDVWLPPDWSLRHKVATDNKLQIIQIGLCVLMSLTIHLHSLHLDAQYGQTWHLLTLLRSGERTGRRLLWSTTLLLPTLLSDSQVLISLLIHGLWWTISGQVKAHVMLTCTNGVSPDHFLVIVASDRPWTCAH